MPDGFWNTITNNCESPLTKGLGIMRKKTSEIVMKYITPKAVSIILSVIYVGSLIPLLAIARYNYPSADDYSIGESVHHTFMASQSIFPAIWQAVLTAVDNYFNWMGNFSSIFFMAIHPGVFGEQWYFLTTWIMLAMLSFSTIYFFHACLVKALKMDKYLCRSISMISLFVMVQCMTGRTEAFYWYCGAVNYIFLNSAGIFMLGGLISAVYDQKKSKRVWDLTMATVMGILAGAGNYMTALIIGIILITAAILTGFIKKWKVNWRMLIPPIGFFTAFVVSVLSPGHSVRSAGVNGMGPVKAIFVSFHYALDYALSDWTNWVVLLMIIVLIPLFWKAAGQTHFTFPYPVLVAVYSFCLLSATLTPPLFAVGNIGAGRLKALFFIVYILLLTVNVGYLTGWVRKKLAGGIAEENGCFPGNTILVLLVSGFFLLFGSLLSIIPEPHYFTYTSAITDLANGSAREYGEALRERDDILTSAEEGEDIVLDPLPALPELLIFDDITIDSEDWRNRAMARYYKVKSVTIRDK